MRSGCEHPRQGDALLIIDMQRDFMPGGALPVPGADALIPTINRWVAFFSSHRWPVIATRDWHPRDHGSFAVQGGDWPVHCVQHSAGAGFAEGLKLPEDVIIIDKGVRAESSGYSAFEHTGLEDRLRKLGIRRLWVCGVATDYCVLASVLDALEHGLKVVLLSKAVKGVDVHAGDVDRALERMREADASIVDDEVPDAQ